MKYTEQNSLKHFSEEYLSSTVQTKCACVIVVCLFGCNNHDVHKLKATRKLFHTVIRLDTFMK